MYQSEEVVEEEYDYQTLFGPAHPGSGNFSLILKMKGETIVSARTNPGFLHRGFEKLMEYREPMQNSVLTDRLCILESNQWNVIHAEAVDELMKYEIPDRAKHIRVIMAELSRIQSHFIWYGMMSLGIGFRTGFHLVFGFRDYILDVFEHITGGRVYPAGYCCPGGVRTDFPDKTKEKILDVFDKIEEMRLFIKLENPTWQVRFKNVGILTKEDAIKLGATGPCLRASGVEADVRRDDPYEIYDQLEFDVPVFDEGDGYARFRVCLQEIRESMKIIRQVLDRLPDGKVRVPDLKPKVKFREAKGQVYVRNELSRGEGAIHMVATGEKTPYRVKVRGPSFAHMIPILQQLLVGVQFADIPAIYWSLNQCPADVDR
ncbi:MAG: NADH-quinone oxidoreductase subunit D [Candidatus Hodarchaeales archaeon]